jgi:hypothetical protein
MKLCRALVFLLTFEVVCCGSGSPPVSDEFQPSRAGDDPASSSARRRASPSAPEVILFSDYELHHVGMAETKLLKRFRELQRVNFTAIDEYRASESHGAPVRPALKLRLSDWGFFWSQNWLVLVVLIALTNGQTLCLEPPARGGGWPYHPSAAFEAEHGCEGHHCTSLVGRRRVWIGVSPAGRGRQTHPPSAFWSSCLVRAPLFQSRLVDETRRPRLVWFAV